MTRSRRTLATAVILACLPVGFIAATAISAPGVPEPRPHGVAASGNESGVRGSESFEQVTRDPVTSASRGTGAEWALTVFRAKNGAMCAAPGRKKGSKVGSINPDGTVTPYPIEDGATCVDLRVDPASVQVTKGQDGTTTVHGLAGPRIESVGVVVNR